MRDNQLIKQLSSLREIKKPAVLWCDQTRKEILQLAEQKSGKEWFWQDKLVFYWWKTRSVVPQPVFVSLATILFLLVMTVPINQAVASSLPGDWLYPVKRWQEKITLTLKQDAASQGAYYLHLASVRLAELKRLPIGDNEQARVLRDYNINLSFAQVNFEASSTSIKLANLYDQSINNFERELNEVVVPSKDREVYQTARELTQTLGDKALAVLVNLHVKDQEPQNAVTQRLSEEINKVEQKLSTVQSKIDKLPISQKQVARVVIESKRQIIGAQDAGEEASKTLAEAKELLEKKEFTLALEKVKEGETITLKTEKVLNEVEEVTGEVKGAEDQAIEGEGVKTEDLETQPVQPSELNNTSQEILDSDNN